MDICVYPVFVFSYVGSGLAAGWSPVQGVLPTVLGSRNWSETKRFTDALCSKVGAAGKREWLIIVNCVLGSLYRGGRCCRRFGGIYCRHHQVKCIGWGVALYVYYSVLSRNKGGGGVWVGASSRPVSDGIFFMHSWALRGHLYNYLGPLFLLAWTSVSPLTLSRPSAVHFQHNAIYTQLTNLHMSTLKMEAACTSETSATSHTIARYNNLRTELTNVSFSEANLLSL
jgi:hypothetical protein